MMDSHINRKNIKQSKQVRKLLEDVAIELDLDTDTVLFYYQNYLRLFKMGWLFKLYKDLKNDFPLFIYLYKRIKKEGLNKHDITVLVKNQQDLIFRAPRWFVQ